ncbi:unnamed protein product [Acanthoscelides obtectus]|uniref:Uncharacterized protein n=1 Tax=Acanthoscelides obtectus TaxID=200917 RepID=A0A9P0K8I8_ACAOB|nr:unnamed protein product [Acanthoscelides obtectus]CAK1622980.1 hypothetical protein AOBTE_LOCUS1758 [Acanthoscelides obtectus]
MEAGESPPSSEDKLLGNEDQEADEVDKDTTIHPFNMSNVTVIENVSGAGAGSGGADQKLTDGPDQKTKKTSQCEGSDSGVEVVEGIECIYQRNLSSNSGASQDFNYARSCDSSILSYEEAYNILLRKNSTLLEDYGRNEDVTSENGSESSSISGPRTTRRLQTTVKKKLSPTEARKSLTIRDRSKSKPPSNPKTSVRIKSIDRVQGKTQSTTKVAPTRTTTKPSTLELPKKDTKRPTSSSTRTSSTGRVPSATPTDDGRWPSIHSTPAPLMSRSLKGHIDTTIRGKLSQTDTKTIEKYATLPRRSKEKTETPKKTSSRENLQRIAVTRRSSRESPSKLSSSLYLPKSKQKVRIYHELGAQTALTMSDLENALAGIAITPKTPVDNETFDKEVHVDLTTIEINRLQQSLSQVTEQFETLRTEHKAQKKRFKELEERLRVETLEKEGLKEELRSNTERVMAILGGGSVTQGQDLMTSSSDSLMALESRFQNALQSMVHQEEEISRLHAYCRHLQMEVDRANAQRDSLMRHQQEVEVEAAELQEFMQAEKTTLHDALKEAETALEKKEQELREAKEECKKLSKISEQRRQESVGLQARLGVLESKSRELLVHQGSSVSGASVALSALIGRLDGLVEELVAAYSISEQELEDVIFHNEAYKNSSSSPESTPERSRRYFVDKTPSPQKGSSFVSAVINAIKNAAQSPFTRDVSKDTISTERSSSNEMLDSETEPCLMMEHVLEDVVIPDGHSHNLISSGHGSLLSSRLTHSESLKDLSQALFSRQMY